MNKKGGRIKGKLTLVFCLVLVYLIMLLIENGEKRRNETMISNKEDNIGEDGDESFYLIDLNLAEPGMIYINGRGELTKQIVDSLLEKEDLDITEVYHVIIGNDVTQIGYNAFTGWRYLESIKIGEGVKKIHNGSINYNPNFKYLFIPDSVERIGKDLLFDCEENCYVISNGNLDFFSTLGIDDGRLECLPNISEYDDIINCFINLEIPYATYKGSNLVSQNPNAYRLDDENLYLYPGDRQFGPYVDMLKGQYRIQVLGGNLDTITVDDVACWSSESSQTVCDFLNRGNLIQCTINLPKDASSIELSLFNNGEENKIVTISEMSIYQIADYEKELSFMKMWYEYRE